MGSRLAARRPAPTRAATHGAAHGRVLLDVIAAQLRQYPVGTVDERWTAQLEGLGGTVWWDRDDMIVPQRWMRDGVGRAAVIYLVLQLGHLLLRLPDIGRLGPLPGEARAAAPRRERFARDAADQRVLDRVRALLAKAESTEFPEEAEALTAKAQELMARHSIDEALLAARSSAAGPCRRVCVSALTIPMSRARPCCYRRSPRRMGVGPYGARSSASAPSSGSRPISRRSNCSIRPCWCRAQRRWCALGVRRDAHGRSRTRSFRQSFLTAYAIRIGERMRGAADDASEQVAAAEGADNLLPVLAARDEDVRRAMDDMFPHMRSSDVTIGNREGWASGRAAANLATLHARHEVAQPKLDDGG